MSMSKLKYLQVLKLVQRGEERAVVGLVVNIWVSEKAEEFVDQLSHFQSPKEDSFYGELRTYLLTIRKCKQPW
jgi:hypothetical protein